MKLASILLLLGVVLGCSDERLRSTPQVQMIQKHGWGFFDNKLALTHDIYPQVDGGVMTMCSVIGPNYNTFGMQYFRANQPGGDFAFCIANYDIEQDSTYGFFMFFEGYAEYYDPASLWYGMIIPINYDIF